MRPFRLMHSRRFYAGSGGHADNEPAVPALGRTASARKIISWPPASLVSSTQRVHLLRDGAVPEDLSARTLPAFVYVFSIPWASSPGRKLD